MLKKRDYPPKKMQGAKKKEFTATIVDEMVAMAKKGNSKRSIAAKFNTSSRVVCRELAKRGLNKEALEQIKKGVARDRRIAKVQEMVGKTIGFVKVLEIDSANYDESVWHNASYKCKCHATYDSWNRQETMTCNKTFTRNYIALSNGLKNKEYSCGCQSTYHKQGRESYRKVMEAKQRNK